MLATFVDIAMARGLRYIGNIDPPLPTITMTLDYMAAAPLDAWVEARVSVGHIGKSTGFVQAMLYVKDQPIVRGSGIYRHFANS